MADEKFPYVDGSTYTYVPPEKRPVHTPVPPVENVPGTGIPDNAFDNPLDGPTHTGAPPMPKPEK